MKVLVIGAGPAGVLAALCTADLGAPTTLLSRDAFGGMAANDGPVPVRTLAHAARLMREARQLGRYGISVSDPVLHYEGLLARVREVTSQVRAQSSLRPQLDSIGVRIHEHTGAARFVTPHEIETESGLHFEADKIILCTGGVSRPLSVPGAEHTVTHSDAWSLESVPPSILVIGAGATGAQVASIFNAFGSQIQLFQSGPRILPTEDEDVSTAMAAAFRESGIVVYENFGAIQRFEKTPTGVRMVFAKDGKEDSAEAALAVVAVGWKADTGTLNLAASGVSTNDRGFVAVNAYLQTSAPHVYAAGDITGRLMLAPQAAQDGYVAGINCVQEVRIPILDTVNPIGSFTDPEYAQVGLTETVARRSHDIVVAVIRFDTITRTIIDGRTTGFCKLIVDRSTFKILGCHVVGERAVEIAQSAAIAMAGGMRVDALSRLPLSFPTYAGVLGRVAASATRQMKGDREPIHLES